MVTKQQIRRLRDTAGQAGDLKQIAVCNRALIGDREACLDCQAVIVDAVAQWADTGARVQDETGDVGTIYEWRRFGSNYSVLVAWDQGVTTWCSPLSLHPVV